MKRFSPSAQSGSAFFIILLAVAMFALLSYAVSQGGRSSAGALTTEQAKSAAQEIMAYADSVQKSVQTLRLRGCTQAQISVESSGVDSMDNASSPDDGSCDVFDGAGGKVTYIPPSGEWMDHSKSGEQGYDDWFFTTGSCIAGIGNGNTPACPADEAEAVMVFPWLKQSICEAINKVVLPNLTNIPVATNDAWLHSAKMDGGFHGGANIKTSDNTFTGKSSGCFQGGASNPSGGYHYYHVLMAR